MPGDSRYRGGSAYSTAANGDDGEGNGFYGDDEGKGKGGTSTVAYSALCIGILALLLAGASFIVFGLMGNRHSGRIDSCKSDVSTLQDESAANLLIDDTFLSQPCNCTVLGDPGNCLNGAVYPNITGNITEYATCVY